MTGEAQAAGGATGADQPLDGAARGDGAPPEVMVGAAFAGGLILARLLRWLRG